MFRTSLTALMYHYVRPIACSDFPGIKGLELSDFEGQLDYLEKNYTLVKPSDVIATLKELKPLPERAVLLTFDDGYKDHYLHVYPVLRERKLSGVFFPPTAAVRDRELLDVNRLHFILASATIDVLIRELEAAVLGFSGVYCLCSIEEYRTSWKVANRFDSADVIYFKRMMQHVLPEDLRSRIAKELFARHVSRDEQSFADDLYLSGEQLIEMHEGGLEVGSHGHRHYWLPRLNISSQEKDIDDSLEFLGTLGLCKSEFWFCYPYGSYSDETMKVLRERGCAAAVTVNVDIADCVPLKALELSRLDTNDLPCAKYAAISPWTDKVAPESATHIKN